MTSTDKPLAPFPSLAALRERHAELLRSLPARGLGDEQMGRVTEFLEAGSATGAILDTPADREAAQGLLDYWKASLYTQHRPSEQKSPPARVLAAVLADFGSAALQNVVDAAEASVQALQEQDPALEGVVRCVLLRLVRLPEEGVALTPIPAEQATFLSCGEPDKIRCVLSTLEQAGVVTSTSGSGTAGTPVQLKYEALMRVWPRLAGWLKKRVLFRDAALFWKEHDRDRGALFTGALLDEAEHYQDLNTLEREFVKKCQQEADRLAAEHARQVWVWRAVTALIGILLISTLGFGYLAYTKTKEAMELERSKAEALEARSIADSRATMTLMVLLQQLEEDPGARHVIKKIQLVKTLGYVAFPDSPGGKLADLDNWNLLKNNLVMTGWFAKFLKDHHGELEQIVGDRHSKAEKRESLLTISRDLRIAIIEWKEQPLLNPLKLMRPHWFEQIENAAEKLAATANDGKKLEGVSMYANQFWRLYCCDLLVEEEEHKAAMVAFGDLLSKWEASGTGEAPAEVRRSINRALGDLYEAYQRQGKQ